MPEGPEIWRTADSLNEALQGQTINELNFAFDELKPFESKLEGKEVEKLEARGKAILTFFEGNHAMYSHTQLYGKWMISKNGGRPDTNRKLRDSQRS